MQEGEKPPSCTPIPISRIPEFATAVFRCSYCSPQIIYNKAEPPPLTFCPNATKCLVEGINEGFSVASARVLETNAARCGRVNGTDGWRTVRVSASPSMGSVAKPGIEAMRSCSLSRSRVGGPAFNPTRLCGRGRERTSAPVHGADAARIREIRDVHRAYGERCINDGERQATAWHRRGACAVNIERGVGRLRATSL